MESLVDVTSAVMDYLRKIRAGFKSLLIDFYSKGKTMETAWKSRKNIHEKKMKHHNMVLSAVMSSVPNLLYLNKNTGMVL